ncbi:MAG: extracellular solute-binding protein [Chloroflexi bacterium]|nr:extracellular solute-binding protein [Chloroflexota bacterium]
MQPPRSLALLRAGAVLCLISLVSACSGGASPTAAPTSGATVAPVTAAPTTAPTPAPTDTPPDKVTGSLNVLDWTGYDAEWAWQDFKNTYKNVKISFDFGDSDAAQYGKMKGGSQADIFHPYTGWLQFYVDEGLAAEIDTTKLKNWDKVPESFKKIGQINGKQYFVPWDWGFTSILYRTDKITTPVDSWAILFDQKYKGHLSMWDDGPGAVTVSSYVHGYNETAITADQLAAIKAEWIAQAPLNKAYWVAEPDLTQMMGSGEVWAAYAWQGAYATLLGQKTPVAYANPKEGRNSWVGVYGISKTSPNYDLALRFLDAKLGLLTGQGLVSNYFYGSSNQDVMTGITDPTLKQAFSVDDPSILSKTNFTPNLTAKQRDDWTAMWTEVKASQ